MENTQETPLSQPANDAIQAVFRMMLSRIPASAGLPGSPGHNDAVNTPFEGECTKLIKHIIQVDRMENTSASEQGAATPQK